MCLPQKSGISLSVMVTVRCQLGEDVFPIYSQMLTEALLGRYFRDVIKLTY